MRTWRVGSFTMGAALVFLGVFLLLQQIFEWDPAIAMMSWWPLLFIVLGAEILLYLGLRKNEQMYVKYDFISIVFISLIGMFGLGMSILQNTGLLELTKQVVSAEERTIDLPKFEEDLTDEIQRVVVETGPHSLEIEGSSENTVVMFGTFRGDISVNPMKEVTDYAFTEKHGDTLFIKMKRMPTNRLVHDSGQIDTTILIPSDIKLEVISEGNDLYLTPRQLNRDWIVTNAGFVNVNVDSSENMRIEANDIHNLESEEWEDVATINTEKGNLSYGNGEHTVKIQNSYTIQFGW